LNQGKGCIGDDAFCELINLWEKRMRDASIDFRMKRSLFIDLAQAAYTIQEQLLGSEGINTHIDSTPVKNVLNLRMTSYMLEEKGGRMLEERGRNELTDLWQFVAAARNEFEGEAKQNRTQEIKYDTVVMQLFGDVATRRKLDNEVAAEEKQYKQGDSQSKVSDDVPVINDDDAEDDEKDQDSELTTELQLSEKIINSMKRYPIHPLASRNRIKKGKEGLKEAMTKRKLVKDRRQRLILRLAEATKLHANSSKEHANQLQAMTIAARDGAIQTELQPLDRLSDEELHNHTHKLASSKLEAKGIGALPHAFQIANPLDLYNGKSICTQQKTGSGKSLQILIAAELMGGLTIVLEPLLSLGGDQVKGLQCDAANNVLVANLEDLNPGSRRGLLATLCELKDPKQGTYILYVSPQSFTKFPEWEGAYEMLIKNQIINLVVVDEAHKFVMDRHYRTEIDTLGKVFFNKVKDVPKLAMSATLPDGNKKRKLEKMLDIKFDKTNSGNMDKRTISYKLEARTNKGKVTEAIGNAVVRFIVENAEGKMLVYTPTATHASDLQCGIEDRLAKRKETLDVDNKVLSLVGSEGKVFKRYITDQFCQDTNRCRCLISTDAGEVGLNCVRCVAVEIVGFPDSIEAYIQKGGRLDRIGADSSFYCRCTVSLEGYEYRWLQIQKGKTQEERDETTEDLKDVMCMIFVPARCIHQLMEMYLEEITPASETASQKKERQKQQLPRLGECKDKCWVCRKEGILPIASKEVLVNILGCQFAEGRIRCRDVPKLLFSKKDELWPGLGASKGSDPTINQNAVLLTLKLIAAGILKPKEEKKMEGKNERSWVTLGWNVVDNKTADNNDSLWAGIPIRVPMDKVAS
jgi:superfamily II DNA helicase RecQ